MNNNSILNTDGNYQSDNLKLSVADEEYKLAGRSSTSMGLDQRRQRQMEPMMKHKRYNLDNRGDIS
jgi:hypothetical protein